MEHLDGIKAQASELKDQKSILAGLARLTIQHADDEEANHDPNKIQGKMFEKLLKGGYG
jgi:hypothetical protein